MEDETKTAHCSIKARRDGQIQQQTSSEMGHYSVNPHPEYELEDNAKNNIKTSGELTQAQTQTGSAMDYSSANSQPGKTTKEGLRRFSDELEDDAKNNMKTSGELTQAQTQTGSAMDYSSENPQPDELEDDAKNNIKTSGELTQAQTQTGSEMGHNPKNPNKEDESTQDAKTLLDSIKTRKEFTQEQIQTISETSQNSVNLHPADIVRSLLRAARSVWYRIFGTQVPKDQLEDDAKSASDREKRSRELTGAEMQPGSEICHKSEILHPGNEPKAFQEPNAGTGGGKHIEVWILGNELKNNESLIRCFKHWDKSTKGHVDENETFSPISGLHVRIFQLSFEEFKERLPAFSENILLVTLFNMSFKHSFRESHECVKQLKEIVLARKIFWVGIRSKENTELSKTEIDSITECVADGVNYNEICLKDKSKTNVQTLIFQVIEESKQWRM